MPEEPPVPSETPAPKEPDKPMPVGLNISVGWHLSLQIAALAFQIIFPKIPGMTSEWKDLSSALVSFLQLVLGLLARYSPSPAK